MEHIFEPTLNGDLISECDIPTSVPWRRHVRIEQPRSTSHRRKGQIYLQRAKDE